MDPILYKCITEGNEAELKKKLSVQQLRILEEKTCQGDTALHVAVQYGTKNIVQELCSSCSALLLRQNMKGDTALHMAAREGLTEIVKVLLSCAEITPSDVEIGSVNMHHKQLLVRMGNKEEDTALHEAARNDHIPVVNVLVAADPEFEYFANKSRKSPLYLAVEQGSHNVVEKILENRLVSAHDGPDGKTALHVAVIQNDSNMSDILLAKKPELIKKVDEQGWTALHYAISHSSDYIISLLLQCGTSIAYVVANDGSAAIHVAASRGKVEAMKTILQHCPDTWGMRNSRGQNILHIAAESKKPEVIEHIFESTPQMVKGLVNEQDNDGNTPFHLAAKTSTSVDKFKGDDNGKKTIKNKENLTALDIVRKTEEELPGNPAGDEDEEEEDPWCDKDVKLIKEHGQTYMIVAALIATVTFTAGLTLPGGYIQDGEDKGKALLSENSSFRVFVVSNSLALVLSVYGIIMYYLALLCTKKQQILKLYHYGNLAVSFAMGALPWVFVNGCFSVLSQGLNTIIYSIFAMANVFGFMSYFLAR